MAKPAKTIRRSSTDCCVISTITIWIVAALVVATAGAFARRRVQRSRSAGLDDDAIRRIELGLPLEVDAPHDIEEARAAEEEFWADPEEPEEFGS